MCLRRGPILAFKWRQTKPKNVYMMTMLHNAVETFTGHLERGTGNPIYKPAAIVEYTKQMGGVDLSDQLMNYYNFLRHSCKWWRKLWVHLFNMVILNGHVLNRAFGHQNNVSHYEYRYILLVPFWSILKFHNLFNLLVTQTTLDMHIGLNDFQSPTKTTKPKLESVSSAT